MNAEERKARAIALLREMQLKLQAQGLSRLPQRSDFAPEDVVLLKAAFGPFPRALEAAGLKPPRPDDRAEHQKQRRIEAKRKRNIARKESASNDKTEGET